MDDDLKVYLDDMKQEIREDARSTEARLLARMEASEARLRDLISTNYRAAQAFAVDVGQLHGEIRALLDRIKKIDSNVTTGVELLTRQSRWHAQTDSAAIDLLIKLNALEKRIYDLENPPLE